jgi:hypothetical protein
MDTLGVRFALVAGLLALPTPAAQLHFVETFDGDWRDRWRERRLAHRPTRYRTVQDGEGVVLRADSRGGASGVWHPVTASAPATARLAWRWKVERPIADNDRERERRGDDYAARVFVVFDGDFASRRARAVCYVWASRLPVGSVFPSPYTANVAMVVVASGNGEAGAWQRVERDVLADYQGFFGEAADDISAVALMVDTDNTRSRAVSYFDDVELSVATAATDP